MFDVQQCIVSQKCPPYIINYSFFSVIIIVQTFITYCCRFYPLCDYRFVFASFSLRFSPCTFSRFFLKRNSETFNLFTPNFDSMFTFNSFQLFRRSREVLLTYHEVFFLSAKVKVARKFARHICSSLRKNQIEMVKIRHVHRKEEYISSPKERKNPLRLLIFKQISIVFFFVFLKERLYDN